MMPSQPSPPEPAFLRRRPSSSTKQVRIKAKPAIETRSSAFRSNSRSAKCKWGALSPLALRSLRELTERFALSIAAGDLQFLEDHWYITHAGLLRWAVGDSRRAVT